MRMCMCTAKLPRHACVRFSCALCLVLLQQDDVLHVMVCILHRHTLATGSMHSQSALHLNTAVATAAPGVPMHHGSTGAHRRVMELVRRRLIWREQRAQLACRQCCQRCGTWTGSTRLH